MAKEHDQSTTNHDQVRYSIAHNQKTKVVHCPHPKQRIGNLLVYLQHDRTSGVNDLDPLAYLDRRCVVVVEVLTAQETTIESFRKKETVSAAELSR